MTFAWPHLLWLLAVPFSWLAWELTHRRGDDATSHPKILQAEAGSRHIQLSARQAKSGRARPWLCIGLALAIVAVARPQWGRLEEPVFDQAREILIAIDLSRSMLTPDVRPSRLDRAKLLVQSLLEKLHGERVGLVVFSGTAFLQSPLSSDYEILREFLPALNPGFLPEGGTNYRALIDASLGAFGSTAAADRFLIVLSDGEATEDNWRERVDDLKKKGIRVIGLGVGTTTGAMIPDGSGGLVKDERGAVVLSKLESATLRSLADSTDGVYEDASNWIDLAALIKATVDKGQKGQFLEKNTVRLVERFQWPLALALWCLLVSFYYEFPVRPKPRELKLAQASPDLQTSARTDAPAGAAASKSATAIGALALFLTLSFLLSPPVRAAEPATEPTPPPPLVKIVSRLAAANQRTARDWAELARETVTWGSRLQSSQQPVPEGPVHDALTAVELGSKLDPKTADWPKLRGELEALLKKPDEKKPEQKDQQDQKQKQDQQKQDQQKQDQQKQDDSKQKDSQQSKSEQSENSDPKKSPPQQKPAEPPSKQENQSEKDSAFGEMKKNEQPPSPPPQQNDTQKVGGVAEKKDESETPSDPSLALPLQKLEQLRNQDSPAELFQLMEGDKKAPPRKKTKDW